MKDPVRLLINGAPEVQDLLRSTNADAPARAQLDHLAARLAPTVAAPASSGVLLPWLVAGVALLGAAGVILLARDRSSEQRQPPPAVIAAEPIETAPPAEPAPPAAEAAPPSVAVAPPAAEPKPAPTKQRKQKPLTQPSPPPELELLTPAQAALHANAFTRALALAERHATLYANGTFTEEREAIAIEALHGLGQYERARTRLTAFTTQYPHSGYRARLERLVHE